MREDDEREVREGGQEEREESLKQVESEGEGEANGETEREERELHMLLPQSHGSSCQQRTKDVMFLKVTCSSFRLRHDERI